jgi:hypothetical protein
MSSPDRRKQQKAKKERLQAKKQKLDNERWRDVQSKVIAGVSTGLRDSVMSGKLCIAVATTLKFRTLVAALWRHEGVHVRAYDISDLADMEALAMAAEEHVSRRQWTHFIEGHLKTAIDIEDDQYALSGIKWPPGEGPNIQGSPMQD